MKISHIKYLAFAYVLFFMLNACKKDTNTTTDNNNTGTTSGVVSDDEKTTASDESGVQEESNQALDEINLELNSGFKKTEATCGATVVRDSATKTIILTYDGATDCSFKVRSGVVSAKLISGNEWKDQGAVVKVTFTNYKVVRSITINGKVYSRSYTINGTHNLTNVTGGGLVDLYFGKTVTLSVHGKMSITFDNGKSRTWGYACKKTYVKSGSDFKVTIEGDSTLSTTAGPVSGVLAAGTTRNGNTFYKAITTPIEATLSCGYGKPVKGEWQHKGLISFSVTLGVDSLGNAVTSDCAYGFKVSWKNAAGDSKAVIVNY